MPRHILLLTPFMSITEDLTYFFLQNLQNTSQLFASLVKEVEDRGAIFLPEIYDADKVKLEGTLKSTREKYNR